VLWEAQTEQVQTGDYAPEREADSKQSKSAGGAGCQFKRRIVSETQCSGQDGGHFAATRFASQSAQGRNSIPGRSMTK
jgi:hypothetical protein